MSIEFRIILTATFTNAAQRDAAYAALKTAMTNYSASRPGELKRADMTRDDYYTADANVTEKVV